jgi:hypothetical protein
VPLRSASYLWALVRAHGQLAQDPDCLAMMLGGPAAESSSGERVSAWSASSAAFFRFRDAGAGMRLGLFGGKYAQALSMRATNGLAAHVRFEIGFEK